MDRLIVIIVAALLSTAAESANVVIGIGSEGKVRRVLEFKEANDGLGAGKEKLPQDVKAQLAEALTLWSKIVALPNSPAAAQVKGAVLAMPGRDGPCRAVDGAQPSTCDWSGCSAFAGTLCTQLGRPTIGAYVGKDGACNVTCGLDTVAQTPPVADEVLWGRATCP